ncbi:unnamed protein product [Brachionus calyciflorus]|uniref:SWIM-type domain-containing protein n=1 Tax=Brachionus calyciflorus TaxID=104777 RepID=A0A813QDY7_9BILA|nr:unnamed protein product [Brachionus calyciflorus]
MLSSCSCIEKQSCTHILAVQAINGIDISNSYKIPNLGKLTKNKNCGATGPKKKGHFINSIDPTNSATTNDDSNSNLYLKESLKSEHLDLLEKILEKKLLIKQNMVIDDQRDMSDIFLSEID